MKQKLITIILALGCVAVGTIGVLTYKKQDHTAPVITVSNEKMSYIQGDSYDGLLKGVKASDDRDGDLTGQVFVDQIVPVSNKKAVVYYVVMDKANNVGRAKKTVAYQGSDNMGSDADDMSPQEDAGTTEENQPAETENIQTASEEQTDNQESTDSLKADGEKPVMSLVSQSETIARGTNFSPLSMVKDVVDDKDDKDTLYRQLHVDGTYDTTRSGTYEITYYVQDSDGNTSDPITFTLTVQ